ATWTEVAAVTDAGQDVYRPAVAADDQGNVWVVWSQNVNGNSDLYARRYREGSPGRTMRVTRGEGPDLNPALACDTKGRTWLAWQGFRDGQSDIFLASV